MSDNLDIDVNFFFGDRRTPCTSHAALNTGYCVWEWTEKGWIIKKNRCEKGCLPQEPMVHGQFRGQHRAVICIPDDAAEG